MSDTAGRLRRRVPAGLLDAGLSSMATFLVGIAAAQLFDAASLGIYAVFFTSYQLGLVLPMFLIYLPAEVQAVTRDVGRRLSVLRSSLPIGFSASVVALVSVSLAVLVVWDQAEQTTVVNLAATVVVPTMVMPGQAHIRRMLHLAGHSWRAASISAVQFITAGVGLGALLIADVPDTLVPFGAFGIAAVCSFAVGLFLAARLGESADEPVGWRSLVASGRWLLVTGIAPNVAAFVIAALIGRLAGSEALGYAEGARLAAQPIMVLGVGLNASLGPRSMEAAHAGDRSSAREVSRIFLATIGAVGLAYMLVAGGPWAWNPLTQLIPQAYEIAGLAALTIVASAMAGAVLPNQRELYGGGAPPP